jgi:RNA recognition motif-containing protein
MWAESSAAFILALKEKQRVRPAQHEELPRMGKRLYVGNLPFNVSGSDLEQMFGQHGTVTSAQVISDRETGRSKGFGFVEMASDGEAQAAIAALNGSQQHGRAITVNEARPKENRAGGGGGGRGGMGGGRGRDRY